MRNPRDTQMQWGVPVNPFTGRPIDEHQQKRIETLEMTCQTLADVLHSIEGTDPDATDFSTRRCRLAGDMLEQVQLLALREVLDR